MARIFSQTILYTFHISGSAFDDTTYIVWLGIARLLNIVLNIPLIA
jgi:hypothetical protein